MLRRWLIVDKLKCVTKYFDSRFFFTFAACAILCVCVFVYLELKFDWDTN